MYWLAFTVMLQDKNAGPLAVLRIIFNDNRIFQSFDDFTYSNRVLRDFIVSMSRHSYLAIVYKPFDRIKCHARHVVISGTWSAGLTLRGIRTLHISLAEDAAG